MNNEKLWKQVIAILASDEFRKRSRDYDRRQLIAIANSIGGQRMLVVHSSVISELQRIPHSNESRAVDAIAGIERYSAPKVEIFMVSHSWLRPAIRRADAHPDTPDHRKAKAIQEFVKWRIQWVQHHHGFTPEIYFWIDYCCIDQSQRTSALPLLPLWVACCERFLRIEAPDYSERAWCRLEALMSNVYSFADHHTSITPDYECRWPYTGREVTAALKDPRSGKATDPADQPLLKRLTELAEEPTARTERTERLRIDEASVKCFRL
jgi:hypothetical protein